MTLGGLWHGAAWTFVAWGLFHGVLLTINHLWRRVQGIRANSAVLPWRYRLAGGLLTFVAVVFGWVLFRATSLESAVSIWTSMLGGYGISLPRVLDGVDWLALSMVRFEGMFHNGIIGDPIEALPWLVLAALLVWCAPNAQELLRLRDEALSQIGVGRTLSRIPDWGWSIVVIATFIIATMNIAQVSEFLYFQF
jgi:hypothetical protein